MSLLSAVEQAIKSRKAGQAKINDSIQLYREILQSLTSQANIGFEELDSADDPATDTDASPGEKEDIELLERALEKALRVRTGTGPSKKDSKKQSAPQKETHTAGVKPKEGMQPSAAAKGNQTTASTFKSASFHRKEHISRGQLHTSALNLKEKTIRSNMLSDLSKAAAISMPTSNTRVPVSHPGESGAYNLPQQDRISSDQISKWKFLRRKTNRLWDKVAALQRKPEPGRSHFVERMTATFPKDWPCGSPDQTRALLNRLTHQGHDLTQHYQAKELLVKQISEAATELGVESHERLQMTAAQLQNAADQVKREWEAWDRWRPEGGCLCPTGVNGVWGDGMNALLPITITYTTEAELQELEKLRMRVALLQQEICLEQGLLDTLSPHLLSIAGGPHCFTFSVLRDVYSLLGEGGKHFPAIVLDSEPE